MIDFIQSARGYSKRPRLTPRAFDVFLRIRVSGLLTDQPIKLSANGRPVWNAAIGEGPRNIHFRVRKQNLGTGSWRLRIRAELALSAELRSQIAALDARMPTIGFERLVVVPENDLKRSSVSSSTRLRYIGSPQEVDDDG
jgi:hypothetical protein